MPRSSGPPTSPTRSAPTSLPGALRGITPEQIERLPAAQRERARELLARVTEIRRANPLSLFDPYPKQHDFLRFQRPLSSKFFLAGNQTGKTTIGLVDDAIQAVDRDVLPTHLRQYKVYEPPFFCRIMTPDFTNTMEGVVFPKLRALLPADQLHKDGWDGAYDKKNRILHFKNDSFFQFATYEQDRDKLGGATLHRVHYDEEPPKGHRSESKIRLVRFSGDELFTLTPLEGLTWTYDEFWLVWERFLNGQIPVAANEEGNEFLIVQASMDDNPYLTPAARAFVLAGLSAEEREAREHGKFVHLHGLIYSTFAPDRHVVREHPVPDNCNVYVGIDPGIRYAFAVVWAYLDTRGQMVVFDELKVAGYNIEQVCDQIHRINAMWRVEPLMYLIDPAAANRSVQTGRSDQDLFRDYGIVTIAGQNDVRAGIGRMNTMLAYNKDDEDSVPQLQISDRCTALIAEVKRYRWKEPPRTGEETREAPIKADDHALDALRYVVMARPYAPDEQVVDTRTPMERKLQDDIEQEWNQAQQSDYVI
jgi:phage terminase large subunit-like protein